MKNFIILCIAVILTITQIGCPAIGYLQIVPSISGRVLDSKNGLGISDAKIIYSFTPPDKSRTYDASTDSDDVGFFEIGPLRHWFYLVYMGSPGYYPRLSLFEGAFQDTVVVFLTVEKKGYHMRKIRLDFPDYEANYFYFNNEKYNIDECIYLWLERED